MPRTTYRPLMSEETAAIQAFAAEKGRKWKEELSMVYWYNARIWRGPVPDMGRVLHCLRNSHGPSWLASYRLPKTGV
jgi:hypothetical protein